MNPLQRTLIEKAGNDNGFEHVLTSDASVVALASARHATLALVDLESGGYHVRFRENSASLLVELQRIFLAMGGESEGFMLATESALAAILRRAASLSRTLPNQAAIDYQQTVAAELAALPPGIVNTEVERIVRQRVGQNKFRDAMLDYWGCACAVTGVAIPAVLRASHAKPWAECASDAERLDVFNGFLLNANLDALFDRFLVSFEENGELIIAPAMEGLNLLPLGIAPGMRLRWVNKLHQPYLAVHRARLQQLILPAYTN